VLGLVQPGGMRSYTLFSTILPDSLLF